MMRAYDGHIHICSREPWLCGVYCNQRQTRSSRNHKRFQHSRQNDRCRSTTWNQSSHYYPGHQHTVPRRHTQCGGADSDKLIISKKVQSRVGEYVRMGYLEEQLDKLGSLRTDVETLIENINQPRNMDDELLLLDPNNVHTEEFTEDEIGEDIIDDMKAENGEETGQKWNNRINWNDPSNWATSQPLSSPSHVNHENITSENDNSKIDKEVAVSDTLNIIPMTGGDAQSQKDIQGSGSQMKMKDVDVNKDGQIDFEEFKKVWHQKLLAKHNDKYLRQLFSAFDRDGNGYIDATELKGHGESTDTSNTMQTTTETEETESDVEKGLAENDTDEKKTNILNKRSWLLTHSSSVSASSDFTHSLQEPHWKQLLRSAGLIEFSTGMEEYGYTDPHYWLDIEENALRDDMGMKKRDLHKWKSMLRGINQHPDLLDDTKTVVLEEYIIQKEVKAPVTKQTSKTIHKEAPLQYKPLKHHTKRSETKTKTSISRGTLTPAFWDGYQPQDIRVNLLEMTAVSNASVFSPIVEGCIVVKHGGDQVRAMEKIMLCNGQILNGAFCFHSTNDRVDIEFEIWRTRSMLKDIVIARGCFKLHRDDKRRRMKVRKWVQLFDAQNRDVRTKKDGMYKMCNLAKLKIEVTQRSESYYQWPHDY